VNNQEQHINNLLQRWISGEITAREEQELQAAAARDVFLREALQGYRSLPTADHAASLANLRQKLPGQKKKVAAFRLPLWSRVAAAVLVLATAWWLLTEQNASTDKALAMEENSPAAAFPGTAQTQPMAAADSASPLLESATALADNSESITWSAPAREFSLPTLSAKKATPAPELANETIKPNAFGGRMETTRATQPDLAAADDLAEMEAPAARSDAVAKSAPTAPSPAPAALDVITPGSYLDTRISNSGVPEAMPGFQLVEGRVTDQDGYPLVGASVMEVGRTNGTVSDVDGFFQLSVAEKSNRLQVSYTGYATQQVDIKAAENLVVLSESGALLDEVVVTGLGASRGQRKKDTPPAASVAEPVGGFVNLTRYIRDHTPPNSSRARVRLLFNIQANGRPVDFQVLESSHPESNLLAIQLLENGPDWEVLAGQAPVLVEYLVVIR
jgi:hypothetical protein